MLALRPKAVEGSVTFVEPDARFSTSVRIANGLCRSFSGICAAIEKRVDGELTQIVEGQVESAMSKKEVRDAVAAAFRKAPGISALIDAQRKVTNVRSSGNNFIFTVE